MEKNVLPSVAPMAAMLRSSDFSDWIRATKWFFELLSRDQSPPIMKEVLRCGVLPMFIFFLTMENQSQELKEVAAQVLICIAAKTSSIDTKFYEAMDSTHKALVLLVYSDDEEVLCHTCHAFGVISGLTHDKLKELILQANLCSRVRQLLSHESPVVVIGALRTLGNLMQDNEDVIKFMLSDGGVELRRLLNHRDVGIKKEACWAICYLFAGAEWVKRRGLNFDLLDPLVEMLRHDDMGIREVAARAISNATFAAPGDLIKYLVKLECIYALCLQLACLDKRITSASLDALGNILKYGEELAEDDDVNPYAVDIYEFGGWALLEDFSRLYDYENFGKAIDLQNRYYVEPVHVPPGSE